MTSPLYSIQKLELFPSYSTRQHYRQMTGKDAPPYDPARQPKNWFDPEASSSPRRNVLYDAVLSTNEEGRAIAGKDGQPALELLVLRREEAATVNIFEMGAGLPTPTEPPIPAPLRPLKQTEQLQFGLGGIVMVRDTSVPMPGEGDGFTASDRRLLQAIAKKLEIQP